MTHIVSLGAVPFFLSLLLLVIQLNEVAAQQCACATTGVNIRAGAGTDAAILHTMTTGECLPYRGDTQQADGYVWLHLTYNGQSAWGASNWLNIGSCAGGSSVQLPGCPDIITRAEWGARAPSSSIGNMPALPIYVFIHHGESGDCSTQASCTSIVKSYQNYHMDSNGWSDIGYNFLVGGDGHAYEGRGWTHIGAHTQGYNSNGIAICFVGNFESKLPTNAALNTARQLIQCGLDNHKINPSYTLKGHRDVGQTDCPGTTLYQYIHSWPHYAPGTQTYG